MLIKKNTKAPRGLSVYYLAQYIVKMAALRTVSGFTIEPRTLRPLHFGKHTFLVSLKDFEEKFIEAPPTFGQAEAWIRRHYTAFGQAEAWIRRHYTALSQPHHFVGGFRNNGIYYLDISVAVKGLRAAIATGYANRQDSIYDPFYNRVINLNYPRSRRA